MPKFTTTPPPQPIEQPVVISLLEESDGAVVVRATRGTLRAEVLRLSKDGKVHRIIGQNAALATLGFKTQRNLSGELVVADSDFHPQST